MEAEIKMLECTWGKTKKDRMRNKYINIAMVVVQV